MAAKQEDKRKLLGLKTDNGNPVPLKSIKVDVHITGYVAEVSSRLTYFNEEETPVEALFTFPVDDGSAVFQFEAEIDGRHIVAEIQEKEQAKLTYQDAVEHGKTAMLLKEDNSAGDIFSCMLGNLPPQSEASLMMTYVIELPQEPDGQLRFTLPSVLNPRYSPDVGSTVSAEGATYVPPCKVPYEFSMTATVEGYHKVTSVTSDRVKLGVKFGEGNKIATVTLEEDFKFDHDLCLIVQYEMPYLPQVILETGNPEAEGLLKEDMLMVSFHPDLKEVAMATNGEYIFVIDRSGSMDGNSIKNAKEALLLFLKSLPSSCYFNIVSFGSTHSSLFSNGSKEYTKESLGEALTLQKNMDADMGGTEILAPLQDIFKKTLIKGHPRRVFVLTDGGVGNTNEVLGMVKTQSQKTSTRVFSLGIGAGVSTALVKGIANNGGGKAEFIDGGDRVQSKVISLLKCAMQPAITDVTINWDLPQDVTPVSIPTEPPTILSAGERLTLFAILQGVDKQKDYPESSVTLKGQQDGKSVTYSLTFALCKAPEVNVSAPVHRLATKVQIKLLQDEESGMLSGDYYGYMSTNMGKELEKLRNRIVDLSRHGNIVSKYSAFVAIDTEGKTVEGKAVERSCPVPTLSEEFASGIHVSEDIMCLSASSFASSSSPVYQQVRMAPNYARSSSPVYPSYQQANTNSRRLRYHCDSEEENSMACSVDQVLERGQHLDDLDLKSADLSVGSARFYKSAAPKKKHGAVMKWPSFSGFFGGFFSKKKKEKGHEKSVTAKRPVSAMASQYSADKSADKEADDFEEDPDVEFSSVTARRPVSAEASQYCADNSAGKEEADEFEEDSDVEFSSDDKMLSVIALQQLHGEWEVSGQLLQLIGVSKENFDKQTFSEVPSVVCTVIVLCWLRKQFSHRQEEWQMIETKALTWLESQNLTASAEDIIQQTTQSLWPNKLTSLQ